MNSNKNHAQRALQADHHLVTSPAQVLLETSHGCAVLSQLSATSPGMQVPAAQRLNAANQQDRADYHEVVARHPWLPQLEQQLAQSFAEHGRMGDQFYALQDVLAPLQESRSLADAETAEDGA
ncbi:MAG: hypothetical protein Tsb0027_14630 [Wenzhouxiangellaceae bacterium]